MSVSRAQRTLHLPLTQRHGAALPRCGHAFAAVHTGLACQESLTRACQRKSFRGCLQYGAREPGIATCYAVRADRDSAPSPACRSCPLRLFLFASCLTCVVCRCRLPTCVRCACDSLYRMASRNHDDAHPPCRHAARSRRQRPELPQRFVHKLAF
jgi:hypothetical protein